jgi:hypothetical protein
VNPESEVAVTFGGEESHRFTRLAIACLNENAKVRVIVDGREPLTARAVHLEGSLVGANLDGYLWLIIIEEEGSGLKYWVAGSNSIRSLATRTLTFLIDKPTVEQLQVQVIRGSFIPGIVRIAPGVDPDWLRLDRACQDLTYENLEFLLGLLSQIDSETAREAALALRAFSLLANRRKQDQLRMEDHLLTALAAATDRDTRIALTEDLGYGGTRASLPTLTALINNLNEDEHVRWAAGVAISRFTGDEVLVPLVQLLGSSTGWTAPGALLGLSRHAGIENQLLLEPVFREYIRPGNEAVLIRYACLGLARFNQLDEKTLQGLLEVLTGVDFTVDVKGFVALAVSGCLNNIPAHFRQHFTDAVRNIATPTILQQSDPEVIWGLEFLAELATLLELNREASQLYEILSEHFRDWRSNYYLAVSLYEQAETLCQAGRAADSLELLQRAIELLNPSMASNNADREAVLFRREIIRGRLALQEALSSWADTISASNIDTVTREVDEVIAIFGRYARSSRSEIGIKRLSEREADYLKKSHGLLRVLRLILDLQKMADSQPFELNLMARETDKIIWALDSLREKFTDHLAEGPNRIVERCVEPAQKISEILRAGQRPETYAALQEQLGNLQAAFWLGTWPMPARSCPAGGLGRGRINVLKEDIPGSGTEADPYRVPIDAPPILNVVAEIDEMAPGGTCVASINCDIANHQIVQKLAAVEGSVRATLVLPDVFSPLAATRCDIQLVFTARDCSQPAAHLEVYLRRESK